MADHHAAPAPAPAPAGPRRNPESPLCGALHPLLDHVECQRLSGHPGDHGSAVEASSVEVVMAWRDAGAEAATGEQPHR